MLYFTPAKTLPEGTVYLTDLTHVADFADWLVEFATLLDQNRRFATPAQAGIQTHPYRNLSDKEVPSSLHSGFPPTRR